MSRTAPRPSSLVARLRAATALLALVGVIAGSGLGGLRYFFCVPMGTTQLSCCCADAHGDEAHEPSLQTACCETRQLPEAAQADERGSRRADLAAASLAAILPCLPASDVAVSSAGRSSVPTTLARAGPTRPLQPLLRIWLC